MLFSTHLSKGSRGIAILRTFIQPSETEVFASKILIISVFELNDDVVNPVKNAIREITLPQLTKFSSREKKFPCKLTKTVFRFLLVCTGIFVWMMIIIIITIIIIIIIIIIIKK